MNAQISNSSVTLFDFLLLNSLVEIGFRLSSDNPSSSESDRSLITKPKAVLNIEKINGQTILSIDEPAKNAPINTTELKLSIEWKRIVL